MNANQELRQQMWELCYELLPPDQHDALVAKIKSDPQTARLYAEVRLQADLVGYASQVEDSSLVLTVDGREIQPARELAPAAGRRRTAGAPAKTAPSRGSAWGAGWFAAAAAAVLVGLIGYGQFRPFTSPERLATAFIVTEVEAPARLQAGLSSTINVRTRSIEQQSLPAEVEVKLSDADGRQLYRKIVETSADGLASIELPGDKLGPGARLEVQASEKLAGTERVEPWGEIDQAAQVANFFSHDLSVSAEPSFTYTMLEKPSAAPGETVRYATLHLNRYSFSPAPATVGDAVVERPDGSPVVRPVTQVADGLALGEFQVPPNSATSALGLSTREKEAQKQVVRATLAAPALRTADDSRQLASGGASAAPAAPQGRKYATGPKANDVNRPQLEQRIDNLSKADNPSSAQLAETMPRETRASGVAGGEGVAEATVLAPGSPVTVAIPEQYAEKILQANIVAQDVVLYSRTLNAEGRSKSKEGETPSRLATLQLPREVDGAVRVDLIDPSQSPPQVVGEQFYYRQPARQLQVNFVDSGAGDTFQFAAGQTVKLQMKVVDENGEPAAATLGVRIWNDEVVRDSGRRPVMLADVLHSSEDFLTSNARSDDTSASLFGTKAGREADEAKALAEQELVLRAIAPKDAADGYALDGAAFGGFGKAAEAGLAVRMEAGSAEAGLEAITDESLVISNAAAVQQQYGRLAAQFDLQQQRWRAGLGRILVIGGVAALGLLGLIVLLRRPVKAPSTLLVLVAATASVVFGMLWVVPNLQQGRQVAAVPDELADRETRLTRTPAPTADYEANHQALPQAPERAESFGFSPGTDATPPADVPLPTTAFAIPAENAPVVSGEQSGEKEQLLKELDGAASPTDAPAIPASPAVPPAEPAPATTAPVAPSPGGAPTTASGSLRGGAGYGGGALPQAGSGTSAPGGAGGGRSRLAKGMETPDVKLRTEADKVELADEREKPAAATDPSSRSLKFKNGVAEQTRPAPADPAAADSPSKPQSGQGQGLPEAAPLTASAQSQPAPVAPAAQPAEVPAPRSNTRDVAGARPAVEESLAQKNASAASTPLAAQPANPGPSLALDSVESGKRSTAWKDQVLDRESGYSSNPGAAPASLYFNPQLATDERGQATIEFTLPAVASEYRVLIDAYGSGRVGSAQALVVGRSDPVEATK